MDLLRPGMGSWPTGQSLPSPAKAPGPATAGLRREPLTSNILRGPLHSKELPIMVPTVGTTRGNHGAAWR